jgi:hypothetical protein
MELFSCLLCIFDTVSERIIRKKPILNSKVYISRDQVWLIWKSCLEFYMEQLSESNLYLFTMAEHLFEILIRYIYTMKPVSLCTFFQNDN